MRTSVETLEDNKIKLTVEVDEEELATKTEETIRRLARDARLPGFRPGKVPRKLLESRLGPKVIREEVLSDTLPTYYSDAIEETALDVISTPEIDITSGEEEGPISFNAIVEVRPEVSIAGYEGLLVTIPSPVASEEEIDAQIDRLRENFATLTEVSRPARDGDLVTLNIEGTRDGVPAEGLTADDLVYEVGSKGIVEGIDEKLFGAKTGDTFEMDAKDAPDGPADLKVTIKLIREKILPEADDAFAQDASEFDTLAELRNDLAPRITSMKKYQANMALQEKALEALANLVDIEPPKTLVNEEAGRLFEDFAHRLSHQNMKIEPYLMAIGKSPEEFNAELETQAVFQVKADLALRALSVAQSIEVDESDLDDEIARLAGQAKRPPAEVRVTLEQSGRLPGLRSQLKNTKALTWLVEHVGIVDEEGNSVDRELLTMETGVLEDDDQHDHDHEHHDHEEEK